MSHGAETVLSLAIVCVAIAIIAGSGALGFGAARLLVRWGFPAWTWLATLPVGLALGFWIVGWVAFPDLGPAFVAARTAPTMTVKIPQWYRGPVYLFFAAEEKPLPAPGQLEVGSSGKLLSGYFPKMDKTWDYARFVLAYPNGETPPQCLGASRRGRFGDVYYADEFIGTKAEYEEKKPANIQFVYQSLTP